MICNVTTHMFHELCLKMESKLNLFVPPQPRPEFALFHKNSPHAKTRVCTRLAHSQDQSLHQTSPQPKPEFALFHKNSPHAKARVCTRLPHSQDQSLHQTPPQSRPEFAPDFPTAKTRVCTRLPHSQDQSLHQTPPQPRPQFALFSQDPHTQLRPEFAKGHRLLYTCIHMELTVVA